jgi:hypothetical protein
LAASAALAFMTLKPNAGEELTGRKVTQFKEAELSAPETTGKQI